MQTVNFEEVLDKILAKDARYGREAYLFVREALDHTQKMVGRPPRNEIRHVTGGQLLDGMRDYALAQYGPMTITVLSEWGIRSCEDIGEIVFNMVEASLLAKTEQDTRDDFKGAFTFEAAFRRPFLPKVKKTRPPTKPKTA
jgi:uncharacterized repeat protein (TIGR04138 family)